MLKRIITFFQKIKVIKKLKKIHTLKKFKKQKSRKRNNLQLKITPSKINKTYIISFLLFLIISTIIISISFLKVKTILIIKKDDISNIDIAYKAIDKYRGNLLFLIKKDKLKETLLTYQKNIKNIDVSKEFPNTLKVSIESYPSVFKTSLNGKEYIVTENGVYIPTSNKNDELMNLEVKTEEKYNFPDYKEILKPNYINKIIYLKNKINDNLLNINIENIFYYPTEREAHFIISNDIIVIFDLNGNIDKQIENLMIFNKEYHNLSKGGIIYIDLRIDNKIFYCKTDDEYTCRKNLESIYEKTIQK